MAAAATATERASADESDATKNKHTIAAAAAANWLSTLVFVCGSAQLTCPSETRSSEYSDGDATDNT